MQTNSSPKLDTSIFFLFSSPFKNNFNSPKTKHFKNLFQISYISPIFCHILTNTTQTKTQQTTYTTKDKRK